MVRRLPGHAAGQVDGQMLAVSVDLGTEPTEEAAVIATDECGGEVAEFLVGCREELSSVEIAECVGREIADQAGTPVYVLKAAFGVVGRHDTEIGPIFLSPRSRQIGHGQIATKESVFELESDQDVEVVRHLVGLHADQRRFDFVDREMKRIEINVADASRNTCFARGNQYIQNGRERPTTFSQSRDWLSWMPSETASPQGVP